MQPYSTALGPAVVAVGLMAAYVTCSAGMARAIIGYVIAFVLGIALGRWTRKRAEP